MKITATKIKKTRQELLVIEGTDSLLEIALQVELSRSVCDAASRSHHKVKPTKLQPTVSRCK